MGVMAGNTVHVQGNYVDVHDNEVVNLSIDRVGMLQVGKNGQQTEVANEQTESVADLLKPMFYGNENDVIEFLASIQDMKPTQITDKVKQLVKAKKISELSKNRDLWKVLHDCGIYPRSESNWNQQVK